MRERENAYYKANKAEFREKYLDKWLVIAGESLYGAYDTPQEAAANASAKLEPGEFLIHKPANDGTVIEIGGTVRLRHPDDINTPKPKRAITYV